MLIGLLLIAFLTMWGIAFVLFERDLACPTMLLLSGYTLSVAVAFFSDFKIPFVYHSQTVFVLIVGTLLFCIPAYAIKTCYVGGKGVHPDLPRSVIDIRSLALLLYAAGLLGTIALSFWVYRDILAEIKPTLTLTYAESVNAMRNYIIANPDGVKIPEFFLLNQVKRIFTIAGYFLLAVWARNAVIRRSFTEDRILFLNLLLTIVLLGTDGGRGAIVAFVLAGIGLVFIFNRLYNNTRITISGALVVKALGVFLVASVAFYAMLYLSGRQSGALHIGALIHHVQFYLGGSIPLLDNFLLTSLGGGGTEIIGKETFYSLVQLMSKLHITDIPLYSVHLEFRPGVYDGNVYTGFRSYIHDFGYAGLVVLPPLFSVCANWLYYAAIQASREKAVAVGLVLYASLMYPIFADFVRCFFFLSFFNINTLCLCLGVILLQLFLLKTGWMRFSPVTSKALPARSR